MPAKKYAQEFEASFESTVGQVFQNIKQCANAEVQKFADPLHEYVLSCDWGRYHDATVVTVYDKTLKEMCFMDRFVGLPFASQVERIRKIYNRFNPSTFLAEANSFGAAQIELLQKEGMSVTPFTMTNQNKDQLVDALQIAFEYGEIAIIPDEILMGELQAFRAERLESGRMRFAAPQGSAFHDDTVIALLLAYHAAHSMSTGRIRNVARMRAPMANRRPTFRKQPRYDLERKGIRHG